MNYLFLTDEFIARFEFENSPACSDSRSEVQVEHSMRSLLRSTIYAWTKEHQYVYKVCVHATPRTKGKRRETDTYDPKKTARTDSNLCNLCRSTPVHDHRRNTHQFHRLSDLLHVAIATGQEDFIFVARSCEQRISIPRAQFPQRDQWNTQYVNQLQYFLRVLGYIWHATNH